MPEVRYAIVRTSNRGKQRGKLRFDTHQKAMNHATILNLDAIDSLAAIYSVVEVKCCRECYGMGWQDFPDIGKHECVDCKGTGDDHS